MMHDLGFDENPFVVRHYTRMRMYELQHYYGDKLIIKKAKEHGVGEGVFVRRGVTLPKGFVLPFWGITGHLYNSCISHFDADRQLQIERENFDPIRVFIHPSCVAGFVNSARVLAYKHRQPNCTFEVNTFIPSFDRRMSMYHYIHPASLAYLTTTVEIVGDDSDASQLLFQYESLRGLQIRSRSFK